MPHVNSNAARDTNGHFRTFRHRGGDRLKDWLESFDPEIVAFDAAQSDAAFAAFRTYGKGVSSTARLNFGDCAAYALAKTRNLPLLYKGTDFAANDPGCDTCVRFAAHADAT